MPNAPATSVLWTAGAPPPPAAAVRRTPFYFEGRRGWLFGWLHRREPTPGPADGVLICPPLGSEQIRAHRGVRHLADALARAGFAAVRFDYHGTGDSGGTDEDGERLATWQANVRDALAWMRQHLSCRLPSLIGLRLGAALAAQAAAGEAVDGLVLWAPVVQGRAYVREMKALGLTASGTAATPGSVEAAGFVLTEETLAGLGRLDLLTSRPLCRRALIVARNDAPEDTRLLEHFRALGLSAEQIREPGYPELMAEPHATQVPRAMIAGTVAWLRAGARQDGGDEEADGASAGPAAATGLCHQSARHAVAGRHPVQERVLHVSRQPELFGIVSEPGEAAAGDLPWIVLLNAGSSYRVGPNRLHVGLARELAVRGFRCLRLDLSGLGDSVCGDDAGENNPYPGTALRDVDLTLRHLQTCQGAARVVLMGLCSGAYTAFQSAARLASPALVEGVLINPLTFYWREGMSLETSPEAHLDALHYHMGSVWRPGKWLKLLAGKSKIGMAGALRILADCWRLRQRPPDVAPSPPPREDVAGDLDRAVKAGRHLACFFATSDPGYRLLTFYARRKVQELRRAGRLSVCFIDDADHTFSRRAARGTLLRALAEHLCRRYPPSGR